MIEKVLKHISFTTLLLSYLFICGILYLIAFWGTFDIDISSLVDITDVPKSFVIPLLYSFGFYFISAIVTVTTQGPKEKSSSESNKMEDKLDDEMESPLPKWKARLSELKSTLAFIFLRVDTYIILSPPILSYTYNHFKDEIFFWLIAPITLGYLVSFKLLDTEWLKELIPYFNLRLFIIQTTVILPFVSFSIGKVNSLNIYKNVDEKYVRLDGDHQKELDKEYKFVGFIGDKLICITPNNRSTIVLNHSDLKSVEIYHKQILTTELMRKADSLIKASNQRSLQTE